MRKLPDLKICCILIIDLTSINRGFATEENNNGRGTGILMAVMIKYYHDTGSYLMVTWRFKTGMDQHNGVLI